MIEMKMIIQTFKNEVMLNYHNSIDS